MKQLIFTLSHILFLVTFDTCKKEEPNVAQYTDGITEHKLEAKSSTGD